MPVVLSRNNSPRPEDERLIRMRDDALRHRSHRFTFSPSKAQEIEKRQKLAYERTTKKPALPKPSPSTGYSDPEWEPARSCWLVYNRSNSQEWKAWEPMKEQWMDIKEFDESCSNPSSPDEANGMGKTNKKPASTGDISKTADREVRPMSRSVSLPADEKQKYTFKSVAQTAWKVLAWRRRASEKE